MGTARPLSSASSRPCSCPRSPLVPASLSPQLACSLRLPYFLRSCFSLKGSGPRALLNPRGPRGRESCLQALAALTPGQRQHFSSSLTKVQLITQTLEVWQIQDEGSKPWGTHSPGVLNLPAAGMCRRAENHGWGAAFRPGRAQAPAGWVGAGGAQAPGESGADTPRTTPSVVPEQQPQGACWNAGSQAPEP